MYGAIFLYGCLKFKYHYWQTVYIKYAIWYSFFSTSYFQLVYKTVLVVCFCVVFFFRLCCNNIQILGNFMFRKPTVINKLYIDVLLASIFPF